jgi:murein DD-endopeptidase MepM/ murein hydrolase activator NlpD
MDDEVRLGYQAAVVSFGSPTYRRLWLSVKPHPGHLLSCQVLAELVQAAEAHTGVRPPRRTDLLRQRLQVASEQLAKITHEQALRQQRLAALQAELAVCCECWQGSELVVVQLAVDFQARGRAEKPYSALAKARRYARHWRCRYERHMRELVRTRKLIQRQQLAIISLQAQVAQLQARLRRFEGENASNIAPVQAVFRLDAGFATWDNVALLIELGYEVYSRPYNQKVRAALLRRTGPASVWTQVGHNAEMIAWPGQQLKGCPYPVDIALERFYTGQTLRSGVLLHFGTDRVTADLPAWFAYYNARQTIEAGIKEGKGVFQMHYLKVRSAPALWLQEQFAAFAANFVRWAAHWLSLQSYQEPRQWLQPVVASVKTLVQVAAHTPATVEWLPDGCLLRFADESLYAGCAIQTGGYAFQLSLPIFQNVDFDPIPTNRALIAQSLR